jgi:hypothetical protein
LIATTSSGAAHMFRGAQRVVEADAGVADHRTTGSEMDLRHDHRLTP